ncbi:MAG: transaldolase [Aggregatilineales bacterium]
MNANDLQIKIFADGADLTGLLKLAEQPYIKGFTTNPTLMRKAGVTDYEKFARQALERITDRPISFEVFSDDFEDMARQARLIAGWGQNVYVKIPVTNTKQESAAALIGRLAHDGLKLNVTAIMTLEQVRVVGAVLNGGAPSIVSVFAGRIADTGCDPTPIMQEALHILKDCPDAELLWASPREVLNIVQADQIGCHIITVTGDILGKLGSLGKDLTEFSLDTVKMFYNDAHAAGFAL